MRRAAAAGLTFLLAVAAALAGPAAGATGIGAGFAQTGDVDADRVVLRAALQPDGDAVWTIAYRIDLDDENTTAAFESLQEDIRRNTSAYADQFARRMRSTVGAAENATGREMAVANVSVSTHREPIQDVGVVTYSFTWRGFAAVSGDRLVVGDVLAGFFLEAGTTFTVAWPDGYQLRSVEPTPQERSENAVTWHGQRTFGPGEPRVVVAPASALPVDAASLAAILLALALLAAGVAWYRRETLPWPPGGSGRPDPSGDGGELIDGSDAGGTGASGSEAAADGASESEDDAPPEELLSPRERVLRLVRDNGGRMKQADVTETLDWSAARTSQVVGELRDAGDLESFRLGRENVLRLPETPDPGEPRGAREASETSDADATGADGGSRTGADGGSQTEREGTER